MARHFAFWGMYFVCVVLTYFPFYGNWSQAMHRLFGTALFDAVVYWPLYLISVYLTLYFFLPKYLRRSNNGFLALYGLVLLALSTLSGYFITKMIFKAHGYGGNWLDVLSMTLQHSQADFAAIICAAVIIKVLKDYFVQQQENEILAVKNIRNKLQLLKMQMHPRILFASLRRIHLELDARTRQAPQMILKLSDLLSYLLYESEANQVLLSTEVKMIETYIALKKLEYKDSIDIRFRINSQTGDPVITPGLFLPLLEIGIERPDNISQKNFVEIDLRSGSGMVYFTLINNMPAKELLRERSVQTAIHTVRKRLQSSYDEKSKLEVFPMTDGLKITLQTAKI